MAVVIETTLGDITVDLYLEQRPVTCLNFLKLCKMKFYNFNLFHTIRSGFIAQTGDPTGEGSGGQSIFGLVEGPEKRFFSGEKMPKIRHTDTGLLSMVGTGDMMIGSQFFFTLGSDLDSLDGIHCVIGEVTEGHEVLRKLNDVICDETHRPYQDVRITHTVILEDPFNDPFGHVRAPSRSPSPSAERLKGGRIAPDEDLDETQGKSAEEIQEMIEEKEAKARATILEIVGDIPDADIAPPENVLFVCKLNPVTTDEDLEIIFSRFGTIVSSEVIRDKKSGDSLQYAFIEFADKKSCEDAYFKMDNVLIDDRRIHVDFSQSVSKIRWLGKGRGVRHMNEGNGSKNIDMDLSKDQLKRQRSRERDGDHDRNQRDKDKYNGSRRHNKEDNDRDHRKHDHREKSRRERSRSRSKVDRSSRNEKHHSNHDSRKIDKSSNENKKNDRAKNDKNQERDKAYNHRKSGDTERDRYYKNHRSHQSQERTNHSRKHESTRNEKLTTEKSHNSKSKQSSSTNYSLKSSASKTDGDNPATHKHRSQKYESKNSEKADDHVSREIKELKNNKLKKEETEKQQSTRAKHVTNKEPRTPSPVNAKKNKEVNKEKKKKEKNNDVKKSKRKRKPSTSSESDSSDSSSSSSDSSSSDSDHKKKRSKRRKRKYTSSSSSSSESSSSSSSSDSSDSSSSSNSECDKKKKIQHKVKRKLVKESQKK